MTRRNRSALHAAALAACSCVVTAAAQTSPAGGADPQAPLPLFENVTARTGLSGVPAKDCILADIDGDGWWDLILDRRHFYLSRADAAAPGGRRFALADDNGIAFPMIRKVPLDGKGVPDAAKATTLEYVPQYLYFADLDNDGDTDAIFGVHSDWQRFDEPHSRWIDVPEADPGVRSAIYLNDGRGHFAKGPPCGFGAKDAAGPAMALAAVDFDQDGNLDLYEGREYRRYGVFYGCGVDRLFRGDGVGRFEDATEAAGLMTVPQPATDRSSRPSYGVTTGDMDGDGHTDLLEMAYGRQWNYQWQNRGDGTFEEVGRQTGFAGDDITDGRYPSWVNKPAEQPFRANGNTFDCAVADFDNDGDMDCFLGEIQHEWAGPSSDPSSLLINLGPGQQHRFRRVPVAELLPPRKFRDGHWNLGDMHVAFFDYDLDGLQDLLIASGDYPDGQFVRLYRQRPDHGFDEVTDLAGFDWEGAGDVSIGDVDRDGDPDLVVGRSFARLSQEHRDRYMGGIKQNEVGVFLNRAGERSGNHWLNVRLVGRGRGGANRAGIGAWITVVCGSVTQTRELRAGSGLANHEDPPEACFGLGKVGKVDRITVRWPDEKGTQQSFANVPVDRFVTLRQGEPEAELKRQ